MKVIFTDAALQDLDEIASYLTTHYPAVAPAVEARLRTVVAWIGRWPQSTRRSARRAGVHVVPLGRYPYKIFCRVTDDAVEILPIHHAARQPWDEQTEEAAHPRVRAAPDDADASSGLHSAPQNSAATRMSSLIDELVARVRAGRLAASMDNRPFAETFRPPVAPGQIATAEARLGFPLPALLRDLYTKVADGGFGPGCGLLRLEGGPDGPFGWHDDGIVDLYRSFRNRSSHRGDPWGEKLLPICHWGCSYYSYLDCALPEAPVMAFDEDSHGHGPWGGAFGPHARSFEEWMQRWVDGEDLWKSFEANGAPLLGFEEQA